MRISARLEAWLARVVARGIDARVAALDARLVETEARLAAALTQTQTTIETVGAGLGLGLAGVRDTQASLLRTFHPETVATRLRDPIEAMVAEALRVPLPPRPRTRTYGPAGRAFTWMNRQA